MISREKREKQFKVVSEGVDVGKYNPSYNNVAKKLIVRAFSAKPRQLHS